MRESAHETISVNTTPIITTPSTAPAAASDANAGGNDAPTKIVASMMSVGNRPLHGTKLFVRIATSRSRGESITRVAMTPAALHDLRNGYTARVIPLRDSAAEARALEGRISDLVNDAYGLTQAEVEVLWRTAPPRMPLAKASEDAATEATDQRALVD